jgi:hypothetical protein
MVCPVAIPFCNGSSSGLVGSQVVVTLALPPGLHILSLFGLAFLATSGVIPRATTERWVNPFAATFYRPLFLYQDTGLPGAAAFNDCLIWVVDTGESCM